MVSPTCFATSDIRFGRGAVGPSMILIYKWTVITSFDVKVLEYPIPEFCKVLAFYKIKQGERFHSRPDKHIHASVSFSIDK